MPGMPLRRLGMRQLWQVEEVGKTVRQIAKETGASIGTVFGVQKTNTSENEHPIFALTFDQLLGDSLELRRGGSWADDGKETDQRRRNLVITSS